METQRRSGNILTWYTDGVMGRINDEPTITELLDGKPAAKVWMRDGAQHRTNGAAVVLLECGVVHGVEFWAKGIQLDTEAVLKWVMSKGYTFDEALGLAYHGWEDRLRLQFIVAFRLVGLGSPPTIILAG